MTANHDLPKYYSLLGLRSGASLFEVKTAFRALSVQSHPDNFEIGSSEFLAAQESQKTINQAYEHLKRHLQASGDTGKPPENVPTSSKTPIESMDDVYNRARAVESGKGQPPDVLKALSMYKSLANMGHAKAQFRVGFLYFDSVMKDLPQAFYWWKRAAENNHVGAQFNLGLMYERGYGAPKDDMEAFRWFKEAAMRGDKQARQKLIAMGAIIGPEVAPQEEPPGNDHSLAKGFLKKR